MYNINYLRRSTFIIIVSVAFAITVTELNAQPIEVNTNFSVDGGQPNGVFTLTLSVDEPVDFYYYGMELVFDSQRFEYLSIQQTGLTADGVSVDGVISHNRIGVSVTRTDGQEISDSGDFMELTFRVRSLADAGPGTFIFEETEMYGSDGQLIETIPFEPVDFEVFEGIGVFELTIPEVNQVTEGEPFTASGRVYASGITADEEQSGRLTTWIGVNGSNSNPTTWDESVWQEMELTGEFGQFYNYTGEIALFRDTGLFFVALRTQLDSEDYHYGGVNGFWHEIDSPSATLEILDIPAFRFIIAHWDFSDEQLTPSSSVPDNDLSEIEVVGASSNGDPISTTTQGSVTYLNTNSWHEEEGIDEKYIQISISTEQFENIQLSSSHTGTGAGPRFFNVQLSQDGEIWENLDGGNIDLGEGSVQMQNLPLPNAYYDNEIIYIRWLRGIDERINISSNSEISATGIHRIANILVTGTNTNPQRVDVLPGDTNNDGVVNAQDVLVIGHYWMARGPRPIYDFIGFEPREVESWIPVEATFADAMGDGIINQRDLLPIGLNFGQGQLNAPARSVERPEPLARLELPQLKAGEEVEILIRSSVPEHLKGLSFRLTVDGIPPADWSVAEDVVPEWAIPWAEENRLLDFQFRKQHAVEEAYIYRGRNVGLEVQDLVVVRLQANEQWKSMGFLTLEWFAVSRSDGEIAELSSVDMIAEYDDKDAVAEIPSLTRLHQNYPNPFNPATMIQYELSGESQVRLDVFNIIGQHVATLIESHQAPGSYTIHFDATDLASGLYLYRLQTNDEVFTKRMMLVK